MVNTFDHDALIVGGGVLETSLEFQRWPGRNPRRDADPAGQAGQHSHPRDAEWRHRRGTRRGLSGLETREAKRSRIVGGRSDTQADYPFPNCRTWSLVSARSNHASLVSP
jgi:hypothetical protein